jgi:hypothetical protein
MPRASSHIWTAEQEETLLETLIAASATSSAAARGRGHKSNVWNSVAQQLQVRHGVELTSQQCRSKKGVLQSLFEEHKKLLKYSGIQRLANGAFDLGAEANAEYIINHPKATSLFKRGMPHEETCYRLWGDDIASGSQAVTANDLMERLLDRQRRRRQGEDVTESSTQEEGHQDTTETEGDETGEGASEGESAGDETGEGNRIGDVNDDDGEDAVPEIRGARRRRRREQERVERVAATARSKKPKSSLDQAVEALGSWSTGLTEAIRSLGQSNSPPPPPQQIPIEHPQDRAQALYAQMTSGFPDNAAFDSPLQQMFIYRALQDEATARTFVNFKNDTLRYLWVKWVLHEAGVVTEEDIRADLDRDGRVGTSGNGPRPQWQRDESEEARRVAELEEVD